MSAEIYFKEEKMDHSYKIHIIGEVDIYTSNQLKEKLYSIVEQNQCDLNIDCKELRYIDSTGLGIFVGALKKVKENGKEIKISNLKENIRRLFQITGLEKLFTIEE